MLNWVNNIPYSTFSSPPVNLEESWSLKKFTTKILFKKLYLPTYCGLVLLILFIFLIKYDAEIIKNSLVFLLVKKVGKFWKIKKSPLSSLPHEFWKVLVVQGGLDNVEYYKYIYFIQTINPNKWNRPKECNIFWFIWIKYYIFLNDKIRFSYLLY